MVVAPRVALGSSVYKADALLLSHATFYYPHPDVRRSLPVRGEVFFLLNYGGGMRARGVKPRSTVPKTAALFVMLCSLTSSAERRDDTGRSCPRKLPRGSS